MEKVDAQSARDAQDVKPVERRNADEKTHFGRGGSLPSLLRHYGGVLFE